MQFISGRQSVHQKWQRKTLRFYEMKKEYTRKVGFRSHLIQGSFLRLDNCTACFQPSVLILKDSKKISVGKDASDTKEKDRRNIHNSITPNIMHLLIIIAMYIINSLPHSITYQQSPLHSQTSLLLKSIAREHLPLRLQDQMLIRSAAWIVIETFDEAVGTAQWDVVEAWDGEGGLGVGGGDEAFFCGWSSAGLGRLHGE